MLTPRAHTPSAPSPRVERARPPRHRFTNMVAVHARAKARFLTRACEWRGRHMIRGRAQCSASRLMMPHAMERNLADGSRLREQGQHAELVDNAMGAHRPSQSDAHDVHTRRGRPQRPPRLRNAVYEVIMSRYVSVRPSCAHSNGANAAPGGPVAARRWQRASHAHASTACGLAMESWHRAALEPWANGVLFGRIIR